MFAVVVFIFMYYFAVLALVYGFAKIKEPLQSDVAPKTKFSIIVPFRNEEHNLPTLLNSIALLNYPVNLFEVILVDDDSIDTFLVPNHKFKIKLIVNKRISKSPKKDAIVTAMQTVTSDWVITTDADCIVSINWLATLDQYIQNNEVKMVAGAVDYQCNNSFLHHFQQLDLASLQGATIGSFGVRNGFMCNGANFAYSKTFFFELNGFEGNNSIASGDDVFLLQKAIAYASDQVHYLKSQETIITTKPLNDWQSLFYQRVRWAAKTSSYHSTFGKLLGIFVFTGNLSIILAFYFLGFWIALLLFTVKVCIDTMLIVRTNKFLRSRNQFLITSSILYPFWSVTVAVYSIFGSYKWKGRSFSK
ncbi:glycosyltransferase [Flavobacterium algicola]|uniref:glycosyltransferase n=1 Tax=Flavobacterium algicola TaxID=556529 RepID=UPI001EFEE5BA|nr:glycosyltransferase [Flavobacterium algicola]MCG9791633.1 glycosyltransferase [Flavobacterium algicola]